MKRKANFAKISKEILTAVSKLLDPSKGNISNRNWQFLFQDVYSLCIAQPVPKLEALYNALSDFLVAHVRKLREAMADHQSDLLKCYLADYEQFHRGSVLTNLAFNCVNLEIERLRAMNGGATKYHNILSLCLSTWTTHVLEPLEARIHHNILREIEQDRRGESANLWIIQGVLRSLQQTETTTEPRLDEDVTLSQSSATRCIDSCLEATEGHYSQLFSEYAQDHTVAEYMQFALHHLSQEEARCAKIFPDETQAEDRRGIISKVECVVTVERIHNECEGYIRGQKSLEISSMYKLLNRIGDAIQPMLSSFESLVEEDGVNRINSIAAVGETVTPQNYVEQLTELFKHYSEMIKTCCNNDSAFVASLDQACRHIVNNNNRRDGDVRQDVKAAELLARFCDSVLKGSAKSSSDGDMEAKLQDLVTLFKYIDDKDTFQKFYSRSLAKRLIHDSSASDDAELMMIGRLKLLCGYEYTAKLQRMFTDIQLSGDLNTRFDGGTSKFNFKVRILQAGAWPLKPQTSEFHIPPLLETAMGEFEKFYNTLHTGRKITWMHHLSLADVKVKVRSGNYELTMTTHQMAVLMLYDDKDEYQLSELKAATGLNMKDLERVVKSLLACRLLKSSAGSASSLGPDTVLSFNKRFASKKMRMKIFGAVQRDTPQEVKDTYTAIDEDRKLFLQAITVRIMKMRKKTTYNELIDEVIRQSKTRYKPSIPQIKKCIENLIEKTYLERQEDSYNVLCYVA